MSKRFLSLILCGFCLLALAVSFIPVHAWQVDQTLQLEGDSFSFAQIQEGEIRMFGPFASETILFGLPANWQLLDGAQLTLDMRIAIRSLNAQANAVASSNYIGNLSVILNGQTISIIPLADDDFTSEVIAIPLAALNSTRADGRMELVFLLSSGETCLLDQQLDIVIQSSSSFTFPHQVVEPNTSFLNFPRPLFQDSIFLDSVRIVVPDQPSAAELQSAMTIAAGLQARTGNLMLLDLVAAREITPDKLSDSHIILVGRPDSLPLFSQLTTLPLAPVAGQFPESAESGVLEMVASPWSPERVVLVVSGNTDAAVIKASQALSTGVIRPNRVANLALIDQVQDVPNRSTVPVDQTLADLGYDDVVFEGRGESIELFQFYVPIGLTVTTEAFVELSLNHTTLMNYDQSGIFVFLNDQPIGSIRLSDTTANQANNRVRVGIPPSAVKPGINNLEVMALLYPVDDCGDPNQDGLFVTLWADETRLFLPLLPISANLNYLPDLSTYPSPFTQSASLSTTAFVVQNENPDAWRLALKLAANLGAITDGAIMNPVLFYADNIPAEERSKYHFLVVGAPSKLPLITELNDQLPAGFAEGSDMATEQDLQVIYKITQDTPVGYLELLESPWNKNNVIVAVLGNLPQGVTWAANSLIEDDTRERLTGNFVVVNNTQTLSADTRLSNALEFAPVPTPIASVDSPASGNNINASARPGWVFVAMIVTGVLIVLVLIVAVYLSWARSRKMEPKESSDELRRKE
jgi:hypothetical protein